MKRGRAWEGLGAAVGLQEALADGLVDLQGVLRKRHWDWIAEGGASMLGGMPKSSQDFGCVNIEVGFPLQFVFRKKKTKRRIPVQTHSGGVEPGGMKGCRLGRGRGGSAIRLQKGAARA